MFSETGLFNKKSRNPVLQPLISIVASWTRWSNVKLRQATSSHASDTRSIAHPYFWEGGQAGFPALSSSPHSTYSRWDSYQALAAASLWVHRRHAATAILEPHEKHEGTSVFAGNWLYHRDNAFVQRAPLHSTKCAYNEGCPGDLYDGAFQPLDRRSSPNREQTHDNCVCRYTYTESCNALLGVCKLKPVHHLLN